MAGKKRRRRTEKTARRTTRACLTALSLSLTKHLAPANGGDVVTAAAACGDANLAFSPAAIYAAMAFLAAGAHGDTLQEILDALGGESRDDLAAFASAVAERALADTSRSGGPAVAFACGAWHDAAWTLCPEFRDAATAAYKADARAIDFSHEPERAVNEINGCVESATNKRIDSILDPSSVNTSTNLVVTSAIYFKGKWDAPFRRSHTMVDKFYRLDGSTTDVPFMRSSRSQLIGVRKGYKVLKLPYRSPAPPPLLLPPPPPRRRKGGSSQQGEAGDEISNASDDDELPKYSMCIFLPDERDGLAAVVEQMASGPGFWHYRLPTMRVPVGDFRLPKFKLSISSSMKHVLRDDMGINSVFSDVDADLSDMAKRNDGGDEPGTPLHVGDVRHKAVLEVNEEGTMAMAATGSYLLCGANVVMDQPETVDFVADHPFLFFVIEEMSRAIVFVGRVLDPLISGL